MNNGGSFDGRRLNFLVLLEENLSAHLPLQQNLPYRRGIEAMRYSLLNGGKRIRALLLFYTGKMFSLSLDTIVSYAVAIEMIHAYSLIHDDLPCMDDDDMRRGKPSNHKVYGEGIATLAGDALLNTAMEILLENCQLGVQYQKASLYMAKAAGVQGMIGGQIIDLEKSGLTEVVDEVVLREMVDLKTAALFRATLVVPAILAGTEPGIVSTMENIALNLGRYFQGQDDLFDITSSDSELGKTPGKDLRDKKLTSFSFFGQKALAKKLKQLENEIVLLVAGLTRQGFETEDLLILLSRIFERSN